MFNLKEIDTDNLEKELKHITLEDEFKYSDINIIDEIKRLEYNINNCKKVNKNIRLNVKTYKLETNIYDDTVINLDYGLFKETLNQQIINDKIRKSLLTTILYERNKPQE